MKPAFIIEFSDLSSSKQSEIVAQIKRLLMEDAVVNETGTEEELEKYIEDTAEKACRKAFFELVIEVSK